MVNLENCKWEILWYVQVAFEAVSLYNIPNQLKFLPIWQDRNGNDESQSRQQIVFTVLQSATGKKMALIVKR